MSRPWKSGVFPAWLKASALTLLTLQVALLVRNAVTGQPILLPLVAVALTSVLTLITFFGGADARRIKVLLRRMALPAAVMALGYGLWFLAALLYTQPSQTAPHWVQGGLASPPTLLLCAGFAVAAYLLSFAASPP